MEILIYPYYTLWISGSDCHRRTKETCRKETCRVQRKHKAARKVSTGPAPNAGKKAAWRFLGHSNSFWEDWARRFLACVRQTAGETCRHALPLALGPNKHVDRSLIESPEVMQVAVRWLMCLGILGTLGWPGSSSCGTVWCLLPPPQLDKSSGVPGVWFCLFFLHNNRIGASKGFRKSSKGIKKSWNKKVTRYHSTWIFLLHARVFVSFIVSASENELVSTKKKTGGWYRTGLANLNTRLPCQ